MAYNLDCLLQNLYKKKTNNLLENIFYSLIIHHLTSIFIFIFHN
jgi:hypothetical protein